MTPAAPPVPAQVPPLGVDLVFKGTDANGLASTAGLTAPTFTIDDPSGVFAFTPAADGLSATLVPNPGVEGQATVNFTVGTTNADGTPGAAIDLVYVGAVIPGNVVTGTLVASDIPAAPPAG